MIEADEFLEELRLSLQENPDERPPLPTKERPRDAFRIFPHAVEMGCIRRDMFYRGYITNVDDEFLQPLVALNFEDQSLYFRFLPQDGVNEDDDAAVVHAKCHLDDIEDVKLTTTPRDQGYRDIVLSITLKRPPRIEADWRYVEHCQMNAALVHRRGTEFDWHLQGAFERDHLISPVPSGVRAQTPMKFGLWTTYRFWCTLSNGRYKAARDALIKLRALDAMGVERQGSLDATMTSVFYKMVPVDSATQELKGPFDLNYLTLALVAHGIIMPEQVHDLVFNLNRYGGNDRRQVAILKAILTGPRITQIRGTVRYYQRRASPVEDKLPGGKVNIRRVIVTPTRVLPLPAQIESSNRVLRQWPEYIDHFLRVNFEDEDDSLRSTFKTSHGDFYDPFVGVYARIRNILCNGLDIAGRRYVFLAAGESQMKEHGCWMIHEEGPFTAEAVRKKMGDFSNEKVVAKHAARMGLCFSATRPVADKLKVEFIDDIKHGDYVYTDGVGNCSAEFARLCAQGDGKARNEKYGPAAVQIRYGGYKGVLSVLPGLAGNHIRLRPSMKKFISDHDVLGAMKVSHYSPAHLNRQAILLMSDLGVSDEAFLDIFQCQVKRARMIETDIYQSLDYLQHADKKIYLHSTFPIGQLIRHQFVHEVMVRNVLRCIECKILHDLKYRARIQVDEGAYLMGIADEFNVLNEGEIFCVIADPAKTTREVITGQVTIFRTPSIHPGDHASIQTTNDVAMSGLTVFRLGGGDLDGDWYTVIWNKALQITRISSPMDYTSQEPRRVDHVTISDIQEFFVDFMKTDVLGLVASSHLAFADLLTSYDPICIELAQLNSDAVDFVKSGIPVDIPERLSPVRFPDYQQKDPHRTYRSNRILGKMFRYIEPPPQYVPFDSYHVDRRLQGLRPPMSYMEEAGKMKHAYDIELQGLMRRYSLSEAEIVTGVVVSTERKQKRKEKDSAIKGPVKDAMDHIKRYWRRESRRFVEKNPSAEGMDAFAKAAYLCTNQRMSKTHFVDPVANRADSTTGLSDSGSVSEMSETGEVPEQDLLSFPWIWWQEPCHCVSADFAIIKEEEED